MKCGKVVIDANGVEHRREWETDETASQFMERMSDWFSRPMPDAPTTMRINPKAYDILRKAIG